MRAPYPLPHGPPKISIQHLVDGFAKQGNLAKGFAHTQLDLSMVFTAHAQFCLLYGANVDIAVNGSFVFHQGVCGFFLRYTRVHKKIVLVSIAKPVTRISRNYNYLTYNFLVFVFTA